MHLTSTALLGLGLVSSLLRLSSKYAFHRSGCWPNLYCVCSVPFVLSVQYSK